MTCAMKSRSLYKPLARAQAGVGLPERAPTSARSGKKLQLDRLTCCRCIPTSSLHRSVQLSALAPETALFEINRRGVDVSSMEGHRNESARPDTPAGPYSLKPAKNGVANPMRSNARTSAIRPRADARPRHGSGQKGVCWCLCILFLRLRRRCARMGRHGHHRRRQSARGGPRFGDLCHPADIGGS